MFAFSSLKVSSFFLRSSIAMSKSDAVGLVSFKSSFVEARDTSRHHEEHLDVDAASPARRATTLNVLKAEDLLLTDG